MRQTLDALYDARIAQGTLRADPSQRAVLTGLEPLRQWLEAQAQRRTGLFAGLFARPEMPRRGCICGAGWGVASRC